MIPKLGQEETSSSESLVVGEFPPVYSTIKDMLFDMDYAAPSSYRVAPSKWDVEEGFPSPVSEPLKTAAPILLRRSDVEIAASAEFFIADDAIIVLQNAYIDDGLWE